MKFSIVRMLVCILCVSKHLDCARILGVVPTPSYNYQIPWRPLWVELSRRGHEVVLITTNPSKDVNFTQIDTASSYEIHRGFDFVGSRFRSVSWMQFVETEMWYGVDVIADRTLSNSEVQKMCAPDSNITFDVVMSEMLYATAIYSLAHRFNVPLIGLSPFGILSMYEHALGGFVLPSHEYTWEMEARIGHNLSFWQRLRNFLTMWRHLYITYYGLLSRQQAIAEKYIWKNLPPMLDILKNTSLIFVDEPRGLTPPRPKLADMITFSSSHISGSPADVLKDLKKFMDTATERLIYFSLGGNAMSSDLPKEVQQIFFDVFAKLPYKVVWKYEMELKNKPDNVYTGKWLPQQNILAHWNIKLFLYQGSLQSTEETIHFTVQVIVFPVLADQDYQAARVEAAGIGKRLDLLTLPREDLVLAIREIVTNKQCREKMIEVKNIVNDHPDEFVEHLAWWTEYVIRHNGAPHLRSNLAWQPWYKLGDMDIVVFLTIVLIIIASFLIKIIVKLTMFTIQQLQANSAGQKQKTS